MTKLKPLQLFLAAVLAQAPLHRPLTCWKLFTPRSPNDPVFAAPREPHGKLGWKSCRKASTLMPSINLSATARFNDQPRCIRHLFFRG